MDTIPTLEVPADIYDEGLAFVNARRAEKGADPIDALPAGRSGESGECPCARACVEDIFVYPGWWLWAGGKENDGGPERFVSFFDKNAAQNVATLPVRASVPS